MSFNFIVTLILRGFILAIACTGPHDNGAAVPKHVAEWRNK